MNAKIPFEPNEYPPATLRLIMAKAESAGCAPSDAMRLLLNEMAEQAGFTAEPSPAPQGKEAA